MKVSEIIPNLEKLRKEKKLKKKDIAEMLGVSKSVYSEYIHNVTLPSYKVLVRMEEIIKNL